MLSTTKVSGFVERGSCMFNESLSVLTCTEHWSGVTSFELHVLSKGKAAHMRNIKV